MSKIHCVGAYQVRASVPPLAETQGFNGYPPLGVNATDDRLQRLMDFCAQFQWAPTLGGECYAGYPVRLREEQRACFNGHPPLGVNATAVSVVRDSDGK